MKIREECLKRAAEIVCRDKEVQYGSPEESFKMISEFWSAYTGTIILQEDVAMMMALLKIARASTSEFTADNYIDIAGYAACGMEAAQKMEERLKKVEV